MTHRLLAPPDDLELESGTRGERIVARIRLWAVLILAPIPLINAIENPHWENLVGAGIIAVAFLLAFNIDTAVRRDPRTPGIAIVSTVADVSLITLALATFLVYGQPLTATNSMVVFEVYFLAIIATTLRNDARLSLLAGGLAIVQYAIIVIVAVVGFDLLNDSVFSIRYGSFSWGTQVSRVILLAVVTALATIVVLRQSELLHRSSVDWLTRLYNRGAFDERLETEMTRSRRHGHPLSVAIIDIDLFKRINDEYGHAAGDEALKQFADALRYEFRKTDLIARVGGEEFVVMMPETPPDNATAKAARFVRAVADGTFSVRRGTPIQMTVSVGVAGLPLDGAAGEGLMEVADARLLEAKRAGRNRVVGPTARAAGPA